MFESPEERKLREMREIEMMMEQARYRAALKKLNEQRAGQSSTGTTGSAGGAAGGGTLLNKLANDPTKNGYVENGYVENYFE